MWGHVVVPDEDQTEILLPSKKFRGRRRYYTRLARKAESLEIDCRPDQWYDFWHVHPDFAGNGNRSWRDRRLHLLAGLKMLRRAVQQAAICARPTQVWWEIDPIDSAQDAVYVHTPNPNGTAFPYDYQGVVWDVEPPPALREWFPNAKLQLGRTDDRWTLYWVRPRGASNGEAGGSAQTTQDGA